MSKCRQAADWIMADPKNRTQTQAAKRFGVSQPAISVTLKRSAARKGAPDCSNYAAALESIARNMRAGAPSQDTLAEREACAILADAWGVPALAATIRARG